jgi:hypothetical protein
MDEAAAVHQHQGARKAEIADVGAAGTLAAIVGGGV